jgi:hypothetical protein
MCLLQGLQKYTDERNKLLSETLKLVDFYYKKVENVVLLALAYFFMIVFEEQIHSLRGFQDFAGMMCAINRIEMKEDGNEYCFLKGTMRYTYDTLEGCITSRMESMSFSKKLLETLEFTEEECIKHIKKYGFFEYSPSFLVLFFSIYAPEDEWEVAIFTLKQALSREQLLPSFSATIVTKTGKRIPCKIRSFRKSDIEGEITFIDKVYVIFEPKLTFIRNS